jgi:hypothetical protein
MKKIVALTLSYLLAVTSLSTPALAQAPQTGALNGKATSNTGRPLPGITVQLRNQTGAVVGSAVTGSDGSFSLAGLNAGAYTLECIAKNVVIGTAKATVAPPASTQNITCASDVAGLPILSKKVLAALGAAAVAIGAVAVVSTRPDGSPAR